MESKQSLLGTLMQENRSAAKEHRRNMWREMREAQALGVASQVSCLEQRHIDVTPVPQADYLFEDEDLWHPSSVASSGTSASSNARTNRDDPVKLSNDMPVGKSNLDDGHRYKRPCRRNSAEDLKDQFTDAYGVPAEYADLPIFEKKKTRLSKSESGMPIYCAYRIGHDFHTSRQYT